MSYNSKLDEHNALYLAINNNPELVNKGVLGYYLYVFHHRLLEIIWNQKFKGYKSIMLPNMNFNTNTYEYLGLKFTVCYYHITPDFVRYDILIPKIYNPYDLWIEYENFVKGFKMGDDFDFSKLSINLEDPKITQENLLRKIIYPQKKTPSTDSYWEDAAFWARL